MHDFAIFFQVVSTEDEEQTTVGDKFVVRVDRAVVDTMDQVVLNMVEAAVDEVAVDKEGVVLRMIKCWEFWMGGCNVLVQGEIKN